MKGMVIGLDVHSKATVYHAQDADGKTISVGSVETGVEGFKNMLMKSKAPQGTRIGLETGLQSTWVAKLISALGMTPVMIAASEVRAKAKRRGQKTDARDAQEICEGLRRGIYEKIVYVPGEGIEILRRLLGRRRFFVRTMTRQVNAAKSLLRGKGLQKEVRLLRTWEAWQNLRNKPLLVEIEPLLGMHARAWKLAFDNVEEIETMITEALKPYDETFEILKSVPGIGSVTAATFIATLGTTERFPTSNHVVSYIGLAPSMYDSGDRERHGQITKQGSREMRTLLVEAAHAASKPRHPLHPYFARISAKSGYKKAVVTLSSRLARILFQMWKKKEVFDVSKLNVIEKTHTRSRTYFYSLKPIPKEDKSL